MFAGVKPQRPELKVLVWREHKSVPHSHDKAPWPVGCHQTIKANIRFHLYGGPQGWNPHSFGPERSPRQVINLPDFVRPKTTFAFPPTPHYYLRASNQARESVSRGPKAGTEACVSHSGNPSDLIVVRIIPKCPVSLKGIEPNSPKARSSMRGAGMISVASRSSSHLTSFASHPSARYHLRASNQTRRRRGVRRGASRRQSVASGSPSHLTSFASHPSAGLRKTPSNQGRFDTPPHTRKPRDGVP